MPSMTCTPDSVVAAPSAANTAGQHAPTTTSGTALPLVLTVWGRPTPVTPAWSATRSGVHARLMCATPFFTCGSSCPAATPNSADIDASASAWVTTGAPPSRTVTGTVMRISTALPCASGTVRSTCSASATTRRAPVLSWLATVSDSIVHSSTAPRRRTGFCVRRAAHRTSGAVRTASSSPVPKPP